MVEDARPARRSRRAAAAFVLCLFLLLGSITVGAVLRSDSIQNTCEAVNGDRAILRAILSESEHLSLQHQHPEFSEAEIQGYYTRALDRLAPADCSGALG